MEREQRQTTRESGNDKEKKMAMGKQEVKAGTSITLEINHKGKKGVWFSCTFDPLRTFMNSFVLWPSESEPWTRRKRGVFKTLRYFA